MPISVVFLRQFRCTRLQSIKTLQAEMQCKTSLSVGINPHNAKCGEPQRWNAWQGEPSFFQLKRAASIDIISRRVGNVNFKIKTIQWAKKCVRFIWHFSGNVGDKPLRFLYSPFVFLKTHKTFMYFSEEHTLSLTHYLFYLDSAVLYCRVILETGDCFIHNCLNISYECINSM